MPIIKYKNMVVRFISYFEISHGVATNSSDCVQIFLSIDHDKG